MDENEIEERERRVLICVRRSTEQRWSAGRDAQTKTVFEPLLNSVFAMRWLRDSHLNQSFHHRTSTTHRLSLTLLWLWFATVEERYLRW